MKRIFLFGLILGSITISCKKKYSCKSTKDRYEVSNFYADTAYIESVTVTSSVKSTTNSLSTGNKEQEALDKCFLDFPNDTVFNMGYGYYTYRDNFVSPL